MGYRSNLLMSYESSFAIQYDASSTPSADHHHHAPASVTSLPPSSLVSLSLSSTSASIPGSTKSSDVTTNTYGRQVRPRIDAAIAAGSKLKFVKPIATDLVAPQVMLPSPPVHDIVALFGGELSSSSGSPASGMRGHFEHSDECDLTLNLSIGRTFFSGGHLLLAARSYLPHIPQVCFDIFW
jgi:hypothetical protein